MIYPCIWHNKTAKEAFQFYSSVFANTEMVSQNDLITVWTLNGFKIMMLDGGPHFSPNASISLFVSMNDEEEIKSVYNKLMDGGTSLFPLDSYPWTAIYGWVKDKYGFSWQLMKTDDLNANYQVWPSILFANDNYGHAEEAINKYTNLFPDSSILALHHYGSDDPDHTGKVMYGQFMAHSSLMSAMDGPGDDTHNLSEGVSLVLDCDTQEEIDRYWNALLEDGGKESRCGWLKDQFGVSWQVVPKVLYELMNNPLTAPKVGEAMMKMIKLDINHLKIAAGTVEEGREVVMLKVEAVVEAPIQKAWDYFTSPEHITQWNHASDDWHCPSSENDFRPGGNFKTTMAAKDGSLAFDFIGTYDEIDEPNMFSYTIEDGRKVRVTFEEVEGGTLVREVFGAEHIHSEELQIAGWQAILNSFKRYVES
jgi:predicted 3-demethylubiquinone-9 3-methyltransferase (glyoxalase superfamily)/uncharacterized protein YndB with AHSA1/START domain